MPFRSCPALKIYTKTGDAGETSLFDGTRVSKTDPRVAAYGDVDELQAAVGVAIAAGLDEQLSGICVQIQRDLFALGARLADPAHKIAPRVTKAVVTDESIARLEQWIDGFDDEVPALRHFILSGGSPGSCRAASGTRGLPPSRARGDRPGHRRRRTHGRRLL